MLKNIAERDRPHMTVWRMRIACWIAKATNAIQTLLYRYQWHTVHPVQYSYQ